MFNRKKTYTVIVDSNEDMIDEVECVLRDLDVVLIENAIEHYDGSEITILIFESRLSRRSVLKRLKKGLTYYYDVNVGTYLIQVTKKKRKGG